LNDYYRYRVELMTNGLIRVFDLASKLSACYNADGTYRHGDLRTPALAALLGDDLNRSALPALLPVGDIYCEEDL
jgi:hypothetical protein